MINLTALSPDRPLVISEAEYQRFTAKTKPNGWSHCESREEWLCKLHYLRKGFREKRLSPEDFRDKERLLVLNWWAKFVQ